MLIIIISVSVNKHIVLFCLFGLLLTSCQTYSSKEGSTNPRYNKFATLDVRPSSTPFPKQKSKQKITPTVSTPPTPPKEDYFVYLRDGKMLLQIPQVMQVNVPVIARLRIGIEELKLKEGIGDTDIGIEDIKISKIVKVRLMSLAQDAFIILPIEHESQLVPNSVFTEWTWSVTPKMSGDQKLMFIITTQIDDVKTGEVLFKDLPVKTQDVYVQINPMSSFQTFLLTNYQWLVGVIIGSGFIGWCWKKIKK